MGTRFPLAVTALSLFWTLTTLLLTAFGSDVRTIGISIKVDGKLHLMGSSPDNGFRPARWVWLYLLSTELKPVEGVHVSPEPSDPLKATLQGRIVIEVEHTGKAEIKELRLIRRTADAGWTVDPKDAMHLAVKIRVAEPPADPPGTDKPFGKEPEGGPPGDEKGPSVEADDVGPKWLGRWGPWRAISLVKDGKKTPQDQLEALGNKLEYNGSVMVQKEGDAIQAHIKLDATKKPKHAEITFLQGEFEGQKALGIYKLDDDTLRLCYAPPGKDRPTEFSSNPGSGHVLIVYSNHPRAGIFKPLDIKIPERQKPKSPEPVQWPIAELIVLGVVVFVPALVIGILCGRRGLRSTR
jgi:uncharacterized protein (TIGR03067 family)